MFAYKHWDYPNHSEEAVQTAVVALNNDNQNLRIATTCLLYASTDGLWKAIMQWEKEGNNREDE